MTNIKHLKHKIIPKKNDLCTGNHKYNILFLNLKKLNEQFSSELRKVDM